MARAGTDPPPCYQGRPDLSQFLLLTSLRALTCSIPSPAPGQSEKKGGPCRLAPWSPLPPRLYHLPPTAAAWEAAGVCTKLPAPASNKGGVSAQRPGGTARGQLPEPEGQAERDWHSSPSWPLTAQTQHPAAESAPSSDMGSVLCLGSTLGHGRAQEPCSSHFPRDMALPILCRETGAQGTV